MKKLLLMVALGVTSLVSANNSTENKLELKNSKEVIVMENLTSQIQSSFSTTIFDGVNRLCAVTVFLYNSEGNYVGMAHHTADLETFEQCQAFHTLIKFGYLYTGYNVTDLW